jgi:ubiquinone biosynthesis protein
MEQLLSRYAGRPLHELAAREVTEEVMAIAFRHHLQLPAELALLLRVIAMSEGLGLRLDRTSTWSTRPDLT